MGKIIHSDYISAHIFGENLTVCWCNCTHILSASGQGIMKLRKGRPDTIVGVKQNVYVDMFSSSIVSYVTTKHPSRNVHSTEQDCQGTTVNHDEVYLTVL